MMYLVDVDITLSKQVYVEADNEDNAKKKAEALIAKDPPTWATCGLYVKHEVTDCVKYE